MKETSTPDEASGKDAVAPGFTKFNCRIPNSKRLQIGI